MRLDRETERNLKTLIRVVFDAADWPKICRGGRSKYDVYAHKLKAAACQNKISMFLEKLCHSLSLQSVRVESKLINQLEKKCEAVLNAVRRETIYYMLSATEES